MSMASATEPRPRRYWPLGQLVLARLREFWREPEAIFWVYGFPILLTMALGIAFRNQAPERVRVDIVEGPQAAEIQAKLKKADRFETAIQNKETAKRHLRTGKVDVAVVVKSGPRYEYLHVPSRPESRLALLQIDDALQREAGRKDVVETANGKVEGPGGRYIDFLIPGLLGMGLMGGGLWGIGFVTVDMRIRKLLKRFLATPMRKGDFLAALMISRLVFMVPEVLILLLFAYLAFGVTIAGSIGSVVVLVLLGSLSFAGIGLLVASRAKTIEAVSGLMNLVMLPMWIFSGVFFSSERFPEALQGFIQMLPLTTLINALRAVMLDGMPLASQWVELSILSGWGLVSFVLALWRFRWN